MLVIKAQIDQFVADGGTVLVSEAISLLEEFPVCGRGLAGEGEFSAFFFFRDTG